MRNILVLGAGRSARALIGYLVAHQNWELVVADRDKKLAEAAVRNANNGSAVQLDIRDDEHRRELIQNADVVASLLPASLHIIPARDCLEFKKHFVTASYNSPELKAMDADVRDAGLVFMGEIGLDPGIDHMSAMRVIDEIRSAGGQIESFYSFAGGWLRRSRIRIHGIISLPGIREMSYWRARERRSIFKRAG
jgi:saccharopine dehydrogenase-like NADP-dependent oxidoreductase